MHRLVDGVPTACRATVRRVLCRDCGRNGTLYDEADRAADRHVRDHLVARVFALGQSGAAAETGIPRATIQRHLEAWGALREPDLLDAAPDFLLLEPTSIRGEPCLLLVDVDRETLVEILPTGTALVSWLTEPQRLPALRVCLPLDPSVAGAVSSALPGARTMLAPAAARRAARREGDLAFRALRRRARLSGCNGMPTTAEFVRACAPEGQAGDGWPVNVIALRTALRAVLDLLRLGSRAAGEQAWAETEFAAAGAERIARWLRTWREAILTGLDHAFVDRAANLAAGARRAIARRRPGLGFADMRALVLLRDFVRTTVPDPSGGFPMCVAEGRPLAGLEAMLAAPAA